MTERGLGETLRATAKRANTLERKKEEREDAEMVEAQDEGAKRFAEKRQPFFIETLTEKARVASRAGEFTTGIVWKVYGQELVPGLKLAMNGAKEHFEAEKGITGAEVSFGSNADTTGIVSGDYDVHFRPTTEWIGELTIRWGDPE